MFFSTCQIFSATLQYLYSLTRSPLLAPGSADMYDNNNGNDCIMNWEDAGHGTKSFNESDVIRSEAFIKEEI